MYRIIMKELEQWKNKTNRKPLIIRGARQVGKTWIMKEFAHQHYKQTLYINFDNNERMRQLFSGDFDIKRILLGLTIEGGIQIDPKNTLLIFDEIQEVPNALHSLKYFYENTPEYHIVSAGSLLGVALHKETSFPVGKVDFINLYPLSFIEFLLATENKALAELLEMKDYSMLTAFKTKYIELLRQYYFIGGMPEVLAHFIEHRDFAEARNLQKQILYAYEQDFSKHAPYEIVPRLRMVWDSIPSQLAKENKKFVYGSIKKGARAKEFELALAWLLDCGLIYKVPRITAAHLPLKAYQDLSAFKLYVSDVGLLGALTQLDVSTLLEGNDLFMEFKGALTEQFVLQQLIMKHELYYWSAENSSGEVDFIFQYENKIIPIEVKAEENLQAKSLKSFCQKYELKKALRFSMSDYREEENLINIPLYTVNTVE